MGTVTIPVLTTNQSNVNAAELNALVTGLANEFNGSIDNSNIKAGANIALSKIALTGGITNTHVNASAAIDGSKIDPDFGAQNIVTTGNLVISGTTSFGDALTLTGDISITGNVTIDGDCAIYGSWASKSANTVYQADTDGILIAIRNGVAADNVEIYSDSANPPTTLRGVSYSAGGSNGGTVVSPVKKDDYYKASTNATSVYWIPLG